MLRKTLAVGMQTLKYIKIKIKILKVNIFHLICLNFAVRLSSALFKKGSFH